MNFQSVNDFDFGLTTAKLVAKSLDGTPANQIKPEVMNTLTLYVSPKNAQNQGVSLSDELIKTGMNTDTTPSKAEQKPSEQTANQKP